MKVLLFLLRRSRTLVVLAALVGALAGLISTALVVMINTLLREGGWSYSWSPTWVFVGLCLALPASRVVSTFLLSRVVQSAVVEMRLRLSQQILSAPLSELQRLGSHRLLVALTEDVGAISGTLILIPVLFTTGALILGCLTYLGWLAPGLLVSLLVAMAIGVVSYQIPMRWSLRLLFQARQQRDELYGHFRGLIEGSKELKLHRQRRLEFLSGLRATAEDLRDLNVKSVTIFGGASSWGQALFFVIIGVLILGVAGSGSVSREAVMGYTLVLLYIMTPLQVLLNALPDLSRAKIAIDKVKELGLALDAVEADVSDEVLVEPGWQSLELRGAEYAYDGEDPKKSFRIGPLDLTLEPGELVFLTGGNGSGKTTLAMLLTGLYRPTAGALLFNGRPIETVEGYEAHRQICSAVFADYHLFDSLLGLEGPDLDARAKIYLEQLRISDKVEIRDGKLSTLALSQGQRKRLALLTAYLEDRPIYLFDEWAAEQDPAFREVFYRRMLPELKAQGKAVVVISHDDRYFDVADRIVKLDYGEMVYNGPFAGLPSVMAEVERAPALRRVEASATSSPAEASPESVAAADREEPAAAPPAPREGVLSTFGPVGRLVAAAACLALVVLSLGSLAPSAVPESGTSADGFSTSRAMADLRELAAAPHPIGSAEHARVRDYVVAQIEAAGLAAEVQSETVVASRFGATRVAKARNVVTRVPGTDSTGAVVLAAHYDTVAHSAGASDDGAAVAALLETLRVASREGPFKNDLVFLFTDGEETGLMGAQAFRERHPWAADVELVLNFEARGAAGPSIMFETGPGTGPLMSRFAAFAPRPVAASYSMDVYRFLPNITDFMVYRRAGWRGFNFAFIGDSGAYHAQQDAIERLDPRSLAHHGAYALSLARGFGDVDLEAVKPGPGAVYFTVPYLGLAVYSTRLVLPLAILAALVAAAILYFAFVRRRLTLGGALLGLLASLGLAVSATVVVYLLHGTLDTFLLGRRGLVADPGVYRFGMVLIALAAVVGLVFLIGRRLSVLAWSAGSTLFWLLLTLATALFLPSTSYLALWPCLAGSLALFVLAHRPGGEAPSPWMGGLLVLLAVPAILLWVPVVSLAGSAFGIAQSSLLGALVGLVASALLPQLALVTGPGRGRAWPVALLVLGLGLSLFQAAGARWDAQRRLANGLYYALDIDEHTALWGSMDRWMDPWKAQYLGGEPERRTLSGFFVRDVETYAAKAPVLDFAAPVVTDLAAVPETAGTRSETAGTTRSETAGTPSPEAAGTPSPEAAGTPSPEAAGTPSPEAAGTPSGTPSETAGTPSGTPSETAGTPSSEAAGTESGRRLELHVASARGASAFFLELTSTSAIRAMTIDGEDVELERSTAGGLASEGHWQAMFYGVTPDGFDLVVDLETDQPLNVVVVDRVYRLPEIPGKTFEPRPDHLRPTLVPLSDASLVRAAYVF